MRLILFELQPSTPIDIATTWNSLQSAAYRSYSEMASTEISHAVMNQLITHHKQYQKLYCMQCKGLCQLYSQAFTLPSPLPALLHLPRGPINICLDLNIISTHSANILILQHISMYSNDNHIVSLYE